jgi:hypothetical protein
MSLISTHHLLRDPAHQTRDVCWAALELGGDGEGVCAFGVGEGLEAAAGGGC